LLLLLGGFLWPLLYHYENIGGTYHVGIIVPVLFSKQLRDNVQDTRKLPVLVIGLQNGRANGMSFTAGCLHSLQAE
jgi:hypothetical protein